MRDNKQSRYFFKIILSIITWSCLTYFGYLYWHGAYFSSLPRTLSADSELLDTASGLQSLPRTLSANSELFDSAGGLKRRSSLSLIGLQSSGLIPSFQEHRPADSVLLDSAGGLLVNKKLFEEKIKLQRRSSLSLSGLRSSGLLPSSQEHRASLYVIEDDVATGNEETIHIDTSLPGLSTVNLITCDKFRKTQIDSFVAAIKSGASWIYLPDTRQEKNYSCELRKFNFLDESSGLVHSSLNQPNLNFHFIPREDSSKEHQNTNSYVLAKFKTPSIQTIFQTSDTHVDTLAPLVVIKTSAPFYFSRHDTLYSHRAFWALLPLEVTEDVWSLWAGKLIQELDDYLIYHSPLKPKDTSMIKLNNNIVSDSVKKLLSQWKCLKSNKFFTCMLTWSVYLVKHNILKQEHVTRIKEWIHVLKSSGYSEPNRLYIHKRSDAKMLNTVQFYPARHDVVPPKPDVKNIFNGKCSEKELSICDLHKIEKLKHSNDTLLLVVFNVATFYTNIDTLEELYRPFFSQIIYCGSNIKQFKNTALKNKSISFLEIEANRFDGGEQRYLCIQAAVFLHYQVKGYLHIADDLILNMWNVMNELPSDQFWFQHDVKVANINQKEVEDPDVNKRWRCWDEHHGSNQTRDVFKYLNSQIDTKIVTFMNLLAKNAGGKNRTYYQASDFLYVPSRYGKDFASFIDIFNKHSVHMEIAFSTIMHGMVLSEEILKFPANYVWHAFRSLKFYKERYHPFDTFMHPIKLSQVVKDSALTSFYCSRYLSCWYKHLV